MDSTGIEHPNDNYIVCGGILLLHSSLVHMTTFATRTLKGQLSRVSWPGKYLLCHCLPAWLLGTSAAPQTFLHTLASYSHSNRLPLHQPSSFVYCVFCFFVCLFFFPMWWAWTASLVPRPHLSRGKWMCTKLCWSHHLHSAVWARDY